MYISRRIKKVGFTMVEVMVVIGIIGTLTVLSIASIKEGNKTFELDEAIEAFVTDLNEARFRALSGEVASGLRPDSHGIFVPGTPGSVNYAPYASIDGNNLYDTGEEETIKEFKHGVRIFSVSTPPNVGPPAPPPIHLAFELFTGAVIVNGSKNVENRIEIRFEHPNTGTQKSIELSPLGIVGIITATCGNNIVEVGEQCDPPGSYVCTNVSPLYQGGNVNCLPAGDPNECRWDNIESVCVQATATELDIPPGCGNGVVQGAEQCDDGNNLNFDGCSGICEEEPDCSCSGSPSTCTCQNAPPPPPANFTNSGPSGSGGGNIGIGSFGFSVSIGFGGFGGGCYTVPHYDPTKKENYMTAALLILLPLISVYTLYRRKNTQNVKQNRNV